MNFFHVIKFFYQKKKKKKKINGTFPYGCITVVYNYILGQLILHNCVLTISVNSLYTLYSLNVDTMFYTVIQSTELVSYYTVDIGL